MSPDTLTPPFASPSGPVMPATPDRTSTDAPTVSAPTAAQLDAALESATNVVAPVWPLRHFVAVNPFLGFAADAPEHAAQAFAALRGARLTMPHAFYAHAWTDGAFTRDDIDAALTARSLLRDTLPPATRDRLPSLTSDDVLSAVADATRTTDLDALTTPTVADVLSPLTGTDLAGVAREQISQWASTYFDEGRAAWSTPWRDLPAYGAWHADACHDHTAERLGVPSFRTIVASLPARARDLIPHALTRLAIPAEGIDAYCARLATSIDGWASYARYQVWESAHRGERDEAVVELLAIRLAWEVVLAEAFASDRRVGEAFGRAWPRAAATIAAPLPPAIAKALAVSHVLHDAWERGWQRTLCATLDAHAARRAVRRTAGGVGTDRATVRPAVQMAFCIDVRSEVFRRALEGTRSDIDTIGFAGFFGVPLEYVPLGFEHGAAHCPVLLAPAVTIGESLADADDATVAAVGARRVALRRAANAWRRFKGGAVSCFAFVEALGLLQARALITDALGLTRPVPSPRDDGLTKSERTARTPTLTTGTIGDRASGIPVGQRADMAANILRGMSLHEPFAPLVVLAGHGATSTNNPHASGLDCGACGGHSGEASARVVAALLNDADVRRELAARGTAIPPDTWFVAALHDTTTDDIELFDADRVPAAHAAALRSLAASLTEAGHLARRERATRLRVAAGGDRLDAAVRGRSRDWSQVRPEWGLAGCASFIAAPRDRTRGLDLQGRAFLHSYEWSQDEGFTVLELILTAPVVVASWINLQYYGSTVDNTHFGSGNKALHNVVGTVGVLEGNGGDLRTGLPWQSVHDGQHFVHEPRRLNVVIEAPLDAIDGILAKHANVRALVERGWLHLWVMGPNGTIDARRLPTGAWETVGARGDGRSAA